MRAVFDLAQHYADLLHVNDIVAGKELDEILRQQEIRLDSAFFGFFEDFS